MNRYRTLAGNSLVLYIGAGAMLRAQTTTVLSGVPGAELVFPHWRIDAAGDAAGMATLTDLPAGRYYLAMRESASSNMERIGVLYVEELGGDQEDRLLDELKILDDRIATVDSIRHGLGGADGTSIQRATLAALRRQRAFAQSKLEDFRRRRDGRSPVRMTR